MLFANDSIICKLFEIISNEKCGRCIKAKLFCSYNNNNSEVTQSQTPKYGGSLKTLHCLTLYS